MCNVETLANVSAAMEGKPVTKTCAGLMVLSKSHPVARRKLRPLASQLPVGKAACDHCRYRTEYCPRYLPGYPEEPHQVRRSLGFTAAGAAFWHSWAALCWGCGLCTLYACPEELYLKEACDQAKAQMRRAGFQWKGPSEVRLHPMREGRPVPTRRLLRRLALEPFDRPAPWQPREPAPRRVILPLKQHAGAPCRPGVQVGDRAGWGQLVAEVPGGALGATIHASVSGRVTAVAPAIVVEAES